MANEAAAGKATPDAGAATTTTAPATDAAAPAAGTPAAAAAAGAEAPKAGEGTTAAAEGGKAGTATPEPKAPDTYELKVPDGAESYIDEGDFERVAAIAKAKGWTQQQAQEALDEHADAIAEQSAAFRAEVDADPIYGGKNLEQTQLQAGRALDRMWPKGSPEHEALGKLLTKSGWGNHRLIVGGLANLGKLMQEDSPTGQRAPSGPTMSAEERLYGKKD